MGWWHNISPISRFFTKIIIKDYNDCWLWTNSPDSRGYGTFYANRKYFRAHRFSWTLFNGVIQNNLRVCHSCDNRMCVNPNHLFLGTAKDNMQDCLRKGRKNPAKGEKVATSVLTRKQVETVKDLCGQGLSQSEVGRMFGVKSQAINKIMRGFTWRN